jgi:hypothetical protein
MNRRQALTKAIQALASVPVLGWMLGEQIDTVSYLDRPAIEVEPKDGWRCFKPGPVTYRVTCQYDSLGRCVKKWAVPINSTGLV